MQSNLSELSESAPRSASASRSARPSLALSAPSPSPQSHASSSRSPAALCRKQFASYDKSLPKTILKNRQQNKMNTSHLEFSCKNKSQTSLCCVDELKTPTSP